MSRLPAFSGVSPRPQNVGPAGTKLKRCLFIKPAADWLCPALLETQQRYLNLCFSAAVDGFDGESRYEDSVKIDFFIQE